MSDIINFVPKGWGFEKWIVNNEKYCGKILFFVKNRKCSLHYHKIKDETFYIQSGMIRLRYANCNEDGDLQNPITEAILSKGDVFHIPVLLAHQMIALEDTELLEFSTQHFDEDSYRIVKGD